MGGGGEGGGGNNGGGGYGGGDEGGVNGSGGDGQTVLRVMDSCWMELNTVTASNSAGSGHEHGFVYQTDRAWGGSSPEEIDIAAAEHCPLSPLTFSVADCDGAS
mmetsp:Transcript_19247/g.43053  ORF Transcript_19247/g.43053 Transcript_19247/m.43053 type:complete len:104 (+) Transcript_19247:103-414(+)